MGESAEKAVRRPAGNNLPAGQRARPSVSRDRYRCDKSIGNDNLSFDPPNISNQHAKTSVKNDGFPFHSGLFGVSRYKLTTKISKKDHCEIV
jgi:hypothetical protein